MKARGLGSRACILPTRAGYEMFLLPGQDTTLWEREPHTVRPCTHTHPQHLDRRCTSLGPCWISMINTVMVTDSAAALLLSARPFSRFD